VVDDRRVLVINRRRKGLEYSVLPGGGVEPGESAADAALRELHEETSLTCRVGSELWHRVDDGREATYFLMTEVRGAPVLSGDEASEHSPDNSFVLSWASADDLDRIRLQPAQIRDPLAKVLGTGDD
jgi:8-oxo-dGTP pyrophosphatase MutT (NUDIX family)